MSYSRSRSREASPLVKTLQGYIYQQLGGFDLFAGRTIGSMERKNAVPAAVVNKIFTLKSFSKGGKQVGSRFLGQVRVFILELLISGYSEWEILRDLLKLGRPGNNVFTLKGLRNRMAIRRGIAPMLAAIAQLPQSSQTDVARATLKNLRK